MYVMTGMYGDPAELGAGICLLIIQDVFSDLVSYLCCQPGGCHDGSHCLHVYVSLVMVIYIVPYVTGLCTLLVQHAIEFNCYLNVFQQSAVICY